VTWTSASAASSGGALAARAAEVIGLPEITTG
jgi:hypothetical protein